ncbi:MAG: sulfite exporter TauE/SafE family protein [Verrucomicrobiae bacterium]|nr:sulfite exporter TauE/SafE family protein [Verrucomicrobiae bacterium]NNJ44365.1 sulfite exporter TauE/SafE family protein [Akkermansiaceae bacterium]
MKTFVIVSIIGVAAGLLGALCGIGGGIVMVPAFVTALGFEQKKAVATSLAVIVIVSLVSTLNHTLRKGESLIDWRIVALAAVAAALAAWFGTDLMHKLSNQHLTRLFGIVLLVFGAKMLLGK